MDNSNEAATPMMQQYLELKQEHQDEVLFFRLGDFYEMFMDDAKEVSRLLNLTLTARNGVPMCGIPHHAAKNYVKRLLDAGKKVAVCEQIELPQGAKGIAKREVVQIVTPATVVEDDFLEAADTNYLCSVIKQRNLLSCSWCSVSEGLFFTSMIPLDERYESLRSFLEQIKPHEIVTAEDDDIMDEGFGATLRQANAMVTRMPSWQCTVKFGYNLLRERFNTVTLKQFGLLETDGHLASAGALLNYLLSTSRSSVPHITNVVRIEQSAQLQIDEATRKNLELVVNLEDGTKQRTLLSVIDMTSTAGGGRLLKRWLSAPLYDIDAIVERQDHIAWFLDRGAEHQRVRQLLRGMPDIIRLSSRVSMRRSTVQDLISIANSIGLFFQVVAQETAHYRAMFDFKMDDKSLEDLIDVMETLKSALNDTCIGPFSPGETIKDGFNNELDELRGLHGNENSMLQKYLARLKESTGIPTVKLSFNKIIGHYIEVPKTHSDKIPASFHRKQTLVHAERYTTDELVSLERELLKREEAAHQLERTLYDELVEQTASLTETLNSIAVFISNIDCFQGLATVAKTYRYTRPELTEEGPMQIEEGRHAVVERFLPLGTFVANPLTMEAADERFCLITGPNMAGKSTYLRQNALIVILAQIGSYVPAKRARIPLVDKLYCRIGASDNLARGESTFLVEMQEAAYILRTATERSFVIMDEIGRGTSTQDGMSIAYAVMRYLVERKIKTLFATHYHELTMLNNQDVQLLTLEVAESKGSIVFLRKLRKGVADSSYGLHVAAMAGMPQHVLRQAHTFQKRHFEDYALISDDSQLDLFKSQESRDTKSDAYLQVLLESVKQFDLDHSTPLQAMALIEQLKNLIETP
ncbi:MAG: DNA mismatch repair protein MutS [Spirochaetales bacterium]|nr:DNA mismatch repair protein MutS [Spirochaetales bacterium]